LKRLFPGRDGIQYDYLNDDVEAFSTSLLFDAPRKPAG